MALKETIDKVIPLIRDHIGVPDDRPVEPLSLLIDDLGADSLDTVELALACEEEFGIILDDDKAFSAQTVNDLANVVEAALDAKAEAQKRTPGNWTPRPHGHGFEIETEYLRLSVSDQTERGCGWVWHASIDGPRLIESGGEFDATSGFASVEDAMRAAEDWARQFCETILAAVTTKAEVRS